MNNEKESPSYLQTDTKLGGGVYTERLKCLHSVNFMVLEFGKPQNPSSTTGVKIPNSLLEFMVRVFFS